MTNLLRRILLVVALVSAALGAAPAQADDAALGLAARALKAATLQPYLGVVATRGYAVANLYAGPRGIQSRTTHIARDTITTVQVVFPNFYISAGNGETSTGGPAQILASVEYPAGTFNQLKFGGAVSGTIPDTSFIVSDPLTLSTPIPADATFYVRNNWYGSNAIPFTGFNGFAPGDVGQTGTTPASDFTMGQGGAVTPAAGPILPPLAIIGMTTKPSVLLIGDSIMFGVQDTINDPTGDLGIAARTIGPYFGYSNMGVPGDTVAAMLAKGANRLALLKYYSHVVSDYGGPNDYGQGAAATVANMQALGAELTGVKRFQTTRMPNATSTDSFATVANQTTGTKAFFVAVNQAIRAGMPNWDGYFDVGSVMESVPDAATWNVGPNGSGALTPDGTHPNPLGNMLIQRSERIHVEAFRR